MHFDKISLYIGVAALILAVPLAIIANLLTPRVRDWYSTTSQRRLRNRIAALGKRLEDSECGWTFTPAEWETYLSSFVDHQTLNIGLVLVLLWLGSHNSFSGVVSFGPSTSWRLDYRLTQVCILLLWLLFGLLFWVSLNRYENLRDMHTIGGRESLRDRIRDLKKADKTSQPDPPTTS
jgi:hypothetical protein